MTDEAQLESVVGGARNSLNWLARADGHMKAAEALAECHAAASRRLHLQGMLIMARVIEPPPHDGNIELFEETLGYGSAAMLHRALAVECLLKGILVQREPEKWVKENPRRLYDWSHDIRELAASANVKLDPEEDGVIDNLTLFIEWGGRYPTAMKAKDHGNGAGWSGDQLPPIEHLMTRLRTTLRAEAGLRP